CPPLIPYTTLFRSSASSGTRDRSIRVWGRRLSKFSSTITSVPPMMGTPSGWACLASSASSRVEGLRNSMLVLVVASAPSQPTHDRVPGTTHRCPFVEYITLLEGQPERDDMKSFCVQALQLVFSYKPMNTRHRPTGATEDVHADQRTDRGQRAASALSDRCRPGPPHHPVGLHHRSARTRPLPARRRVRPHRHDVAPHPPGLRDLRVLGRRGRSRGRRGRDRPG